MDITQLIVSADINLSRTLIDFAEDHRIVHAIAKVGANLPEAKGVIVVLVFWFLWFAPNPNFRDRRFTLASILCVAIIAIAAGRMLANTLPFRFRPLATPEVMAGEVESSRFLGEWSSMPSDHAILFFALATGIFLISHRVGVVMFLHAAIVVCLSRVLLGLHFVTDVLVGAVIGIILGLVLVPLIARGLRWLASRSPGIMRVVTRPEIGYPVIFFVTYEFATMFNGARLILRGLSNLLS